jgi:hypothetical protein
MILPIPTLEAGPNLEIRGEWLPVPGILDTPSRNMKLTTAMQAVGCSRKLAVNVFLQCFDFTVLYEKVGLITLRDSPAVEAAGESKQVRGILLFAHDRSFPPTGLL